MDERREAHSETYDTLIDHVETRRLERERDNKKKHFDAKLEKLAQTTVDFEQKYGKDHDMTTLLTTFLDVALEMKNLMETMTAINVAMECINDAIQFLDTAIDFDNVMMDQALDKNYGFWARVRHKRKMKKTIRNNIGRMRQIADGLKMKYSMATDMMKALSGVSTRLKTSITKSKKKQEAKAEKARAKGEVVLTTPSPAELYLDDYKKRNGISDGAAEDDTAASATAASGSSDVSSIDDIL